MTLSEAMQQARAIYQDARVTTEKGFVLVHLDGPTDRLIEARGAAFDPDTYFCPTCPLCRQIREGRIAVFDEGVV